MVCCALILLIAGAPAAVGELPPYVYTNLQGNAPEHLQVKVLSVKTKEGKDGAEVFIGAKVTAVMRSASNLKVGDFIHIEYFHSTSRVPGPGPVPLLDQDQVYEAFLSRYSSSDKTYTPAARGKSFLSAQ
jgi:hypothetical protein